MQVKVTGRHMSPTEKTRAYAEEKFGRIGKIYDAEPVIAEVVLEARKNRSNPDRFIAEVTVRLKGHVVRAEESAPEMHAAIDLAADKAETQMRKYKSRVVDRRSGKKRSTTAVKTASGDDQISETEIEAAEPIVSRTKIIDVKPMSNEEAALQLDLLGHDFFVFRDEATEEINVLYRRTGGDYGLIQPRA
jgi:putative sigma-54 modulation protein